MTPNKQAGKAETNYKAIPIPANDFIPEDDTLIIFDNGEILRFDDMHPFAVATHYLVPVPDSFVLTREELTPPPLSVENEAAPMVFEAVRGNTNPLVDGHYMLVSIYSGNFIAVVEFKNRQWAAMPRTPTFWLRRVDIAGRSSSLKQIEELQGKLHAVNKKYDIAQVDNRVLQGKLKIAREAFNAARELNTASIDLTQVKYRTYEDYINRQ